MFSIFDCTKLDGVAFIVPNERLAARLSLLLTKATGTVHDYAPTREQGLSHDQVETIVVVLGTLVAVCLTIAAVAAGI
jgi:hypothetical protein